MTILCKQCDILAMYMLILLELDTK